MLYTLEQAKSLNILKRYNFIYVGIYSNILEQCDISEGIFWATEV